ncbi:RNA binding protein, putative [Trypanosoma cruzi marinkellei]|uniref:RNA binding protein, putative n=1 Tax=Trypanosoma cruzi marinkellei TaxID=85056 RepID=K2NVR9_TRYCR|nr:RNA binding protein, putative [Trypanosoma cruzi marinkellei]
MSVFSFKFKFKFCLSVCLCVCVLLVPIIPNFCTKKKIFFFFSCCQSCSEFFLIFFFFVRALLCVIIIYYLLFFFLGGKEGGTVHMSCAHVWFVDCHLPWVSLFLFLCFLPSCRGWVGVPAWWMVSFTCNYCHDVVKKPKVNGHAAQCGGASFTCVDCMEVFDMQTIKQHTSCVTETEKYQGKWRQKRAPAAATRSCVDGPDDSDGDGNDNYKRQPLRPPRPPMNLSSDSDDDDDDDAWVTGGKKRPWRRKRREVTGVSTGLYKSGRKRRHRPTKIWK